MERPPFTAGSEDPVVISGISTAFAELSQIQGQVTHALLTRAPLYSSEQARSFSFDLHVLGTPPAFVLSQDQTLQLNFMDQRSYFFIIDCKPKIGITIQFSKNKLAELL